MTATATLAPAAELILVRLLAQGKRPLSPGKVRSDLGRFFHRPPTEEEWQGYVNDLVSSGLLEMKPFRLTDAGRAQALEMLGWNELPPRASWRMMRPRYVTTRVLGTPAGDEKALKARSGVRGLAPLLLRRRLEKEVGELPPKLNVVEFLALREACQRLGIPPQSSWPALQAAVLSASLGEARPLKKDQVVRQLAAKAVRAPRSDANGLRDALLRDWVGGEAPAAAQTGGSRPPLAEPDKRAPEPGGFDLPSFAATVRAAARDCPDGRFGDNKVFINHVWQRLRNEPNFPRLDLPAFKGRLAEANHAGLLRLERADLVQAMNPADVRESETPYENARFHFVLIERDLP
jgi:hypothetical protein